MQITNIDTTKILADLATIKQQLQDTETARITPEWIPKKAIMKFLDYGDTQMSSLLNSRELIVSTVGKRKFVQRQSFIEFLEKNIN